MSASSAARPEDRPAAPSLPLGPTATWWMDEQEGGRLHASGLAELLGVPADDVPTRLEDLVAFAHPEDVVRMLGHQAGDAGPDTWAEVVRLRRGDGHEASVLAVGRLERAGPEGRTRLWVTLTDVTELRARLDDAASRTPPTGAGTAAVPSVEAAPRRVPARPVVLVVDDERLVRDAALRYLQRSGYEAVGAENAAEAFAFLEAREGAVDVVVADFLLPSMRGDELLHELRTRWPRVRALVMSGFIDDATVRDLLLERGTPFLQKPFPMTQLVTLVESLIAA